MIPLYVLAIISAIFGGEWAYHGLFINLWHGFFLGVLAYEAGVRNRNPVAFFVLAAVVAIRAIYIPGVFGLPCTAMALLLFVMARAKKLDTWFFWAWLQWLGAISYSLYLVHVPILTLAGGAWQSFFGRGIVADLGSLIFQIASCLVAAALMRKIIEKPCQQLASRLFSKRRNTSAIATPPLENF
jgi:peptidoglycan/LPS O-acetylase OafA/YrhL